MIFPNPKNDNDAFIVEDAGHAIVVYKIANDSIKNMAFTRDCMFNLMSDVFDRFLENKDAT